MELKDAKSFRVSAQKARAKEMPKIPKDHDEMDPEKVKNNLANQWLTLCLFTKFVCIPKSFWGIKIHLQR